MQVRIPFSFALPVFFTGLAVGLMGVDFTFTHRFFLPEYGSDVKLIQGLFSLVTLLGGGFLLAWGAWLIQRPPVLEIQSQGMKLYNAWGANPVRFPLDALQGVQIIRVRQQSRRHPEGVLKERWIVLQFDAHPKIPARLPLRFGLQYERYSLRIATFLINKKAQEIASFLAAFPGIATTYIDKD